MARLEDTPHTESMSGPWADTWQSAQETMDDNALVREVSDDSGFDWLALCNESFTDAL